MRSYGWMDDALFLAQCPWVKTSSAPLYLYLYYVVAGSVVDSVSVQFQNETQTNLRDSQRDAGDNPADSFRRNSRVIDFNPRSRSVRWFSWLFWRMILKPTAGILSYYEIDFRENINQRFFLFFYLHIYIIREIGVF